MRCECGGTTRVVDGHHVGADERRYTRRRECNRCGGRFNTTEAVMKRIELMVPEGVVIEAAPLPSRRPSRAKVLGKTKK